MGAVSEEDYIRTLEEEIDELRYELSQAKNELYGREKAADAALAKIQWLEGIEQRARKLAEPDNPDGPAVRSAARHILGED